MSFGDRHTVRSCLAAVVLCSACTPWPMDDPNDPFRCDPACDSTHICYEGQCRPKKDRCGDGTLDSWEQCDSDKLRGKTCTGQGFLSGTLRCANDCTPDTSGCTWLVSAGGTAGENSAGVGVDAAGNSYVAGYFSGVMTLGTLSVEKKTTGAGLFVARLDREGRFGWALGSTSGAAWPEGIAVDSAGNSYITGTFTGTMALGDKGASSKGEDVFVAKVSAAGKVVWLVAAGAASHDKGHALVPDAQGNVHVVGRYSGKVSFGSTTLSSTTASDVFVARLSPAGKFLWATSLPLDMWYNGNRIALDAKGNSYITGHFKDSVTIGTTTLTSKGDADVFVARLDASGKIVWVSSAGGKARDWGQAILADDKGVHIAGGCEDASFGSTSLTTTGKSDIFVARLDLNGKFQWAVSAGGTSHDIGYNLAPAPNGGVYLTGNYTTAATIGGFAVANSAGGINVFVARMDQKGSVTWVASPDSATELTEGLGIAPLAGSNVLVTGNYNGTLTLGQKKLVSRGSSDVFVWKAGPSKP